MKLKQCGRNLGVPTEANKERSRRKGRSHVDRPFVMATFAMTVDGKITTRNFSPVDFTSREDKLHLFRQRALADAVLIGHTTLKRDNVRLGLRRMELREERVARGQSPSPIRVIVSNQGKIDPGLNLFNSDPAIAGPIIIFSTTRMPGKIQAALREKATLHLLSSSRVDLKKMLQKLHTDYGIRTVACEGGPTLFRSMLERGLVDQLNLTVAPYLFGGADAPTLTGLSKEFLPRSVHCSLSGMRVVGDECFLTYHIKSR
jgi:2,5-diamino-6-(ribosylamino)-4(3H)-pyrimidinone 5'-phosphate reductase